MKFEKNGNHQHPVDTENDMWLCGNCSISLADIIEKAQEKWHGVSLEDIELKAVNHHEYCVGYDLYDSSDYVQYIYVSVNKGE